MFLRSFNTQHIVSLLVTPGRAIKVLVKDVIE